MIRIQSHGGMERKIKFDFVCDICKDPIDDIGNGAVVFRSHGLGEGELLDVVHVHKMQCHDTADFQLVGPDKRAPWHELSDHLNDKVAGMGVSIRGMIEREVVWSCALTPDQHAALQQKISSLGNWLREHGVASPLWD